MANSREYDVLVSSKDFAREDETGTEIDYVSLFDGKISGLDEAKAFALDLLHKARAEDPNERCYLGAFIDSLELREDDQPVELWAIEETENDGFVTWLAGEGQ